MVFKNQCLGVLAALIFFSNSPSAGNIVGEDNTYSHWFFSAYSGPVWTNAGEDQTISVLPSIPNRYVANRNTRTLIASEIFFGYQSNMLSNYFGQLGVSYAFTDLIKFSGNICENSDPKSNQYAYRYEAMYTHINIKGKLYKQWTETFAPYLGASLGVGFNRTDHFYANSHVPGKEPMQPFINRSLYDAFNYTFEVGFQKTINSNLFGGIGYQFADWGKNSFNPGSGSNPSLAYKTQHFYTNGLQLSLTYMR
jgi:opacity protein-like surface antigen